MMNRHLQLLLIGMLLFGTFPGITQVQSKVEWEIRIDAEGVPEPARRFIEACQFDKKIRWYEEHSLEAVSFEAKTRMDGRKYSIEFDSSGLIEDVEYEIGYESIPAETRELLHNALCVQFEKYIVVKTQLQWTGSAEILLANLQDESRASNPTIRYEIVCKGITENGRRFYEILFDQSGDILRKSVIVPRNTDHLDY